MSYYPVNQRPRRTAMRMPEGWVEETAESYWVDDGYDVSTPMMQPAYPPTAVIPVNGMSLVGIALLLFMAFSIWQEVRPVRETAVAATELVTTSSLPAHGGQPTAVPPPPPALPVKISPIYPYEEYTLTQGLHGYSYGHMAIDIAAGDGATIMSPIDGEVTALYTDEWHNPTIVIENDFYQITMLHGKYTVALGDKVAQGQPIGTESNLGYTMDMQGNLCNGRNCGYHTHLNIFDKQLGANVNPLDILQ